MTYHVALSTDRNRQRAVSLVQRAPADWMAVIKPRNRSDEQNKRLWAMLHDVAKARPGGREHTPDVWKCIFLAALGHEQVFEMGLDGRPFPLGFRSSKLTVQQMADLITFIDAWATQNGVTWSKED
jgi:hypothetical protein